jgi:hypothetical protein
MLMRPIEYAPEPAACTSPAVPVVAGVDHDVELWLLGQPPLARLLEFVGDTALPGHAHPRGALIDAWRRANERFQSLELSQAGLANEGTHRALDPQFNESAAQVAAHPHYTRTFNSLPTGFEMVELDKLIVFQQHVTYSHVQRQMAQLGPAPDALAQFHFCLPLTAPQAAVQIQQLDARRFVFRSRSLDLRFHEAPMLSDANLQDVQHWGVLAGMLGIKVGFGGNLLNAIRVGKRVLLNNGYHRATTLRALGVTHAPCIVQTATCADELAVTTKTRVADDPGFYFESARPPMLMDFFDPTLRMLIPTRKREKRIEVSFEVKEQLVCD